MSRIIASELFPDEVGEENFFFITIECIFTSRASGEKFITIMDMVIEQFGVGVMSTDVVWSDEEAGPGAGGVALYDIYPRVPGLVDEFNTQLEGFRYTLREFPTNGESVLTPKI